MFNFIAKVSRPEDSEMTLQSSSQAATKSLRDKDILLSDIHNTSELAGLTSNRLHYWQYNAERQRPPIFKPFLQLYAGIEHRYPDW